MHKRFLSIFAVFAVVGSLLVVGAFPASANHTGDGPPPASLLPDDDGDSAGNVGTVLSDRFDGTDSLAHLTAVAPANVDRVKWFACPSGVTPPLDQSELGSCTVVIGEDTTAATPIAGSSLSSPDEAYETFFDIPSSIDTSPGATAGNRDVAVLACVGAGDDIEGTGQNCLVDLEENIFFDDAATGDPDTTTAEETQICTFDIGGPGVGPATEAGNPCQYDTNDDGDITDPTDADTAAERAAVDARFHSWHHGDPAPNDGFVIRATSSPDLVSAAPADLFVGTANDVTANHEQDTRLINNDCTPINPTTTTTLWECDVTDAGAADDNKGESVYLDTRAGGNGNGFCNPSAPAPPANDCILDSHYTFTSARAPAKVTQSFVPGGGDHAHSPPSPAATAGCHNARLGGTAETPEKTHADTTLSATEEIEICVDDQFGDPFSGANVTEEIAGPGTFGGPTDTGITGGSCPGGTTHDHDGDGTLEHCHALSGGDGTYQSFVADANATTGTVTITSCVETEPTSTATGHGCSNESLKDTLTLTYTTRPREVFLAYTDPAPTDAADPCRTGTTFKRNTVGESDGVVVCTFDSEGNPVGTDVDGSRLQFAIVGAQGEEPTAIRIEGTPPDETTGTAAQATLTIDAVHEGDNFLVVNLLNANGDSIDEFSIEKQVHAVPHVTVRHRSSARLSHRLNPHIFRVRVRSGYAACVNRRLVHIWKKLRGPDAEVAHGRTGSNGTVTRRHRFGGAGTYYATVEPRNIRTSSSRTDVCRATASNSRTVTR